jgi:hypothetical protein
LSYENRLRVGLAVDTGVITDGEEGARNLINWMINDLKELAQAVHLPLDDMFIDQSTPKSFDEKPILPSGTVGLPTAASVDCISIKEEGISRRSSEDSGFGDEDEPSMEELSDDIFKPTTITRSDSNNNRFLLSKNGESSDIPKRQERPLRRDCPCSICSDNPIIVSQTVRYRCLNGGRS